MPAARVPQLAEQVLVARFPDSDPDVHVASLDADRGLLVLREAAVVGGGQVSLGAERIVSLADAGSVDVGDGVVALLSRDGQLLVQIHQETAEDQRAWADGLRAAIGANQPAQSPSRSPSSRGGTQECAPEDTDDADAQMLQARSRELQERIASLESISQRRDKQLKKMNGRQAGAMEMLNAVQEMCFQQKNVIAAQKTAIIELRKECGETENGANGTQHKDGAAQADDEDDDEDPADAEADIAAKTEQMMALLKQADEMQRALQELEAMKAAYEEEPSSAGTSPSPAKSPVGSSARAPQTAPAAKPTIVPHMAQYQDEDDEDDEETAEVQARLVGLESEKERYEGLLQDSQKEHEDLLKRLEGMRSMMTMLGMSVDDEDGDAEDN